MRARHKSYYEQSKAQTGCWSLLSGLELAVFLPLPHPPTRDPLGSDLLASSAKVRSRSGRESSQSRIVSLSSPLQGGQGS